MRTMKIMKRMMGLAAAILASPAAIRWGMPKRRRSLKMVI